MRGHRAALLAVLHLALLLLSTAVGVAQPPPLEPLPTDDFRVIVHDDNALVRIEASRLSKIFLKRITRWDDGTRIEPVDLTETDAARRAFSDAVHGKSVSAIKSYWQRMIFSGRDVPPPEQGSDAGVVEYVRNHPAAVGYVSPDAELGEGVRELEVLAD